VADTPAHPGDTERVKCLCGGTLHGAPVGSRLDRGRPFGGDVEPLCDDTPQSWQGVTVGRCHHPVVPGSPGGRRRGIGPTDVAVVAACALAVLLAGPRQDLSRPGSGGAGAAQQAVLSLNAPALGAPVLDADGVQRRLGAAAGPSVALTFDDGPDPRWTPAVLELLRQHRIRATFCLVGRHVAQHPEVVRRIAADGHALCNHSWSHDGAMQRRSAASVSADLARTSRAITEAAGRPPHYYRAPGGNWAPTAVAEAGRQRLRLLGWSVDPYDWRRPPSTEIARRVLAGAGPGAIVLLHDGYGARANTVAALRSLLGALAARQLRFITP
jgi:peptidoglycan-N-acetylglucosamine deacetylase